MMMMMMMLITVSEICDENICARKKIKSVVK